MTLRKKILLYFSVITPLVTGISFLLIYVLFSENREEGFQSRQKEKIITTLELLAEIRQIKDELITEMDQLTINDLYDEKLLLFNSEKELIYSSVDDTPVPVSRELLSHLNARTKWIETKEGLYDVVGTYVERNGTTYYGISKAYDTFGYSKLRYLKYILVFTFCSLSLIILLVSFYTAKKITQPLISITERINSYDFEDRFTPLQFEENRNEIAILANQFNKLMKRVDDVLSFQKHTIHHISHELKTPIAVLVSNFERIERETDPERIRELLHDQKEDTKSLGEIINSLLEIAKTESGNSIELSPLRIDELIFDVSDELKNVHPEFRFSVEYDQLENEETLVVDVNARLMKAALMNLMLNCVRFSSDKKAKISISVTDRLLSVAFYNNGPTIREQENQFLFQHFFRGENSKGKRGFGLGLVFIHKIIQLHHGNVVYRSAGNKSNTFIVTLPLR